MNKFLLITVLFCCEFVQGQVATVPNNSTLANRKPQITSPNAAAIEKFIEFPAAAYTGVPDISIPIYEVKTKGFSLPVAISYHASGVKVDEVSSDVGLGWSLMAGGVINILPNGLIDEVSAYPINDQANHTKVKNQSLNASFQGPFIDCTTAFIYSDPLGPDPYGLYAGQDITLLSGVVNETADSEPDIYSFSAGGMSGKFFQDENAVFRTIPYSEKKIERIVQNGQPIGYTITDESGNIFEFKWQIFGAEEINDLANPYQSILRQSRSYYLTKITTSIGEVIQLTYSFNQNKPYYSIIEQNSLTRSKTSSQTSCWQLNSNGNYFSQSTNSTSRAVANTRLESISSNYGTELKFIYSAEERKDLPTQSQSKSLAKIEVWLNIPEVRKIKDFTMGQTYFGNNLSGNYNDCRLKLNSITESGKPPTQFHYQAGDMPRRLSYSQDHYGYYNGRNNLTLLPLDEYNEFWDGADRNVDPTYLQVGILKKIIHSTGGSTEFEYEPNQFWDEPPGFTYPKITGPYLASFPNQTVSSNFSIPSNAKKIRLIYQNSFDGTNYNNDHCIIKLTGPNNFNQTFVGNSHLNNPPLNLPGGQYTISIENVGSTYAADVTVIWFNETANTPHNEYGGGVRIKEIKKYDGPGNPVLVRKFEYTLAGATQSSGLHMLKPVYINYLDRTIHRQDGTPVSACSSINCQLVSQNTSSIGPLVFANGATVLYSKVVTYERSKQENGYTELDFLINTDGLNMGYPSFPFSPRIPFDWANGTLIESRDFKYNNGQYQLVKKSKNTYNYTNYNPSVHTTKQFKAYGAKIAVQNPPFICVSSCGGTTIGIFLTPISFGIQYYSIHSSWHRLESTEETLYDMSGGNSLVSLTSYFYDNTSSIQPTRTEVLNSRNETIITKVSYPKDYTSAGFVQTLLNKHIYSSPIEKVTILKDPANNQYVVSAELITYKTDSGLPDKVYTIEADSPLPVGTYTHFSVTGAGNYSFDSRLKQKTSIVAYDQWGNVLEIINEKGEQESFLYGYSRSLPVARVMWSDHNTVSSYVNESFINYTLDDAAMRGHLNVLRTIPGAFVSTYTYLPMVGMTSESDPNNRVTYYEYDLVNRLKLIKDHDNNILKKICYNYQGQVEDCNSSCTNTNPDWQNTTAPLRCQVEDGFMTGYQEQQQQDVNPCSPTSSQTRWVIAGYNGTACYQSSSSIPLNFQNLAAVTGFYATYTNIETGQVYNFSVPLGSGSLGMIPKGAYNIRIYKPGNAIVYLFSCLCSSMSGREGEFYKIGVSFNECNSIIIGQAN